MLDDHTITTICKVLGGLSTTRLRADLGVICKFGAFFNFFAGGQSTVDFYRKNYCGQTII